MKKSAVVAIILAFGLVCGAIGAGAATGIQQIKAALNHNLKFTVDDQAWTPKDGSGNKMSPIVYKGSTYLPARAVAEALGAEINLVGNTIAISSNNANNEDGIPYNDAAPAVNSASKPAAEKPAAEKPSTQSGAMKYVGSETDMQAKLKNEALKVIHLYGQALEEGKPDGVVNYISTNVSSPIKNSPLELGKPYYMKRFKDGLEATLAKNDADVIAEYAKALQEATLDDVDAYYLGVKNENFQTFAFKFAPENFDYGSTLYVDFGFFADQYDSKTYILGQVELD